MVKFIRRKLAKWTLVRQLEREAWQQEMNAAYNEQVIEDLNGKIEEQGKEIASIEVELLDVQDTHEFEKRQQRKNLLKKKREHEEIIQSIKDMIARVIQAASNERQKAAQAKHRAKFIRKQF